ncbi:MAG: glycerol-3-phosphate 1-O-acyltransferase PlsB [Pseudomonadales bacterium]|nr:glycerol-3-phosphate 1-O-acyltransferase PlsB [Pseudomonadales bacterium]
MLRARVVRQAAAAEARDKKISRRQALLRARAYGEEIAANYSHAFVRFLALIFTRIWNRVYDGVIFSHADSLPQVAQGNEIVYVPCHRSHMDYLLLSYAIYNQGYAIPHVAAGINLNMPVIGRLLRKGGAFFIRRSFGGNALYTAVFMKYLAAIMARGHSIEYFIEGGRSRTGRLLQPKTGMLTMTVRSYLRDPVRPVVFMPVYFGYERIVEAATYVSELSGKPKKKEGFLDLVRAVRVLRERFGEVHVNLGEPLHLEAVLDQHLPEWRTRTFDDDTRHPGINAAINDLAGTIMQRINAAAAVNPINLLALCLLATPRSALVEQDLLRQLQFYLGYLATSPYGDRVTVTRLLPAEILAYAESLGMVARDPHKLGDVIRMTDANAVLTTYYRNNVLHLFAMPSLIACAFIANAEMRTEDIQRLAGRIYPYVASELFLKWREDELPQVVIRTLAVLRERGVLECNPEQTVWCRPPPASPGAMQLSLLSQLTLQFIERYYLAIAILIEAGPGQITRRALAERCQLMAQRMTLLYGFNSPEFFDRALFENFIDLLRERRALRIGEGGNLEFDDVLEQVARDAQIVLSEQIRHSILQVTHD